MKKHIICLGDSNTHGYCTDPADSADGILGRFNEEERWPCLLQKLVGDDYLVIEEGLSGRTTCFQDPAEEGMAAIDYLHPCMKSHKPVALLIIMLGTNDTKERFGANPRTIALGMERLVQKAKATHFWLDQPNILIVAPAPIGPELEQVDPDSDMGKGCSEKSFRLAGEFRLVAERNGVHFMDAAAVGAVCNKIDFMHLTREGHRNLAKALADRVPGMILEEV